MTLYQVDYHVIGQFWTKTYYDAETDDEEDLRDLIAKDEDVDPEDVELLMDSLQSYSG